MDLESIMLSEVSQTEKDKYCMISLICEILKRKHRKRDQICGYQRWRWEEGELEEGSQKVETTSYKINKY